MRIRIESFARCLTRRIVGSVVSGWAGKRQRITSTSYVDDRLGRSRAPILASLGYTLLEVLAGDRRSPPGIVGTSYPWRMIEGEVSDQRMPVIYLSHGAPPLADDPLWTQQLADWSASMLKPTSVLMVSAHWENDP